MVPEIIDGKRFRDGVAVAEIDGLKRGGWNDERLNWGQNHKVD